MRRPWRSGAMTDDLRSFGQRPQAVIFQRSPSVTFQEKELLVSLIERHGKVVESRSSDGVTRKQKAAAWVDIRARFNGMINSSQERSVAQLRSCYRNLKTRAKTVLRTARKTGDTSQVDLVIWRIAQLAPKGFKGLVDMPSELADISEGDKKDNVKGLGDAREVESSRPSDCDKDIKEEVECGIDIKEEGKCDIPGIGFGYSEESTSDQDDTLIEEGKCDIDITEEMECDIDIKEEAQCDIIPDHGFEYSQESTSDQNYTPAAEQSSVQCSKDASESDTSDKAGISCRYGTRGRGQDRKPAFNSGSNGMLADDESDKHVDVCSSRSKRRQTKTRAQLETCRVCEYMFESEYALQTHFKTCHEGVKPYACRTCGKAYQHSSAFGEHLKSHSLRRVYTCPYCYKVFRKNYVFTKHLGTHADDRPRTHKCMLCGKTFFDVHTMKRHRQTHTDEKSHQCDICGRGFIQKADLGKHYMIHTKVKPFECDICRQRFARKHVLLNHILRHTGEKPYKCEQCDNRYARKDVLVAHRKLHEGNYEHGCGFCGNYFPSKQNLLLHVKYTKCSKNAQKNTPV